MKDEIKMIKAELKYIISSIEGWEKFKDSYNYEMVLLTIDRAKEEIITLKEKHFPEKDKKD